MFDWVDILESKLDSMPPVGTDVDTVKQQLADLKVKCSSVRCSAKRRTLCVHAPCRTHSEKAFAFSRLVDSTMLVFLCSFIDIALHYDRSNSSCVCAAHYLKGEEPTNHKGAVALM